MNDFNFNDKTILLCDPDPDSVISIRNAFNDVWVGSFNATPDPDAALKKIKELKPDLVLLSMRFPNISGVQVLQEIRRMDEGAYFKMPLLMLLHKVNQTMLREACKIGIEGVVRKPIDQDKLLRFARSVIMRPRRFVAVSHYFGPERRQDEDPHFEGEDRRKKNYHRVQPGKSQLDSSPVLSTPAADSSSAQNTAPVDVLETAPTPTSDDDDMDWGQSQDRTAAHSQQDWQDSLHKAEENKPEKTTAQEIAPKKEEQNFPPTDSPEKTELAAKDDKQAKDKTVELEEVIDLEECLDGHKEWVNSGGKQGKQAKRPKSDFRGKDLEGSHFSLAVLPLSNFDQVNCQDIDFRKADLRGCSFKASLLMGADMRVTRLTKADLRKARLDRANLLGADLAGAQLAGASLRGVNLSGANLTKTDLRGVNLSGTQGLIPDQIKRAVTDSRTLLPPSLHTAK